MGLFAQLGLTPPLPQTPPQGPPNFSKGASVGGPTGRADKRRQLSCGGGALAPQAKWRWPEVADGSWERLRDLAYEGRGA